MKRPQFADLAHYFEWCRLIENTWRARVRANPKTAIAERSLAKFHEQYPEHTVNLAQWRIQRARRKALAAARQDHREDGARRRAG